MVEAGGKVLMLGAPLDTMTVLHHAEHLADLPGKRIHRRAVPFAAPEGTTWRMIEEYDTGDPVVDWLPENIFEQIVKAFLGERRGQQGQIGDAPSVLVAASDILPFGIAWLEAMAHAEATPETVRPKAS